MKPKHDMHFLQIQCTGIIVFIGLLLLFMMTYLMSCKALGTTGVVVASVVFLLIGVILIAVMVVVIKSTFRRRKGKNGFL